MTDDSQMNGADNIALEIDNMAGTTSSSRIHSNLFVNDGSAGNFIDLSERCDTQLHQPGDEHNCRNKANIEISDILNAPLR